MVICGLRLTHDSLRHYSQNLMQTSATLDQVLTEITGATITDD